MKPSITYRATFTQSGNNGPAVQTDRWFVRSRYGVILAEVYDRELVLQIAELLGIKEAVT